MWCNSRISLAFINLSLAQTFGLFQYAYVLHVVTLQSKLDCYLLVCTLFTSMYLVCSLHFLNVCYIFWCIWPPKKLFDEDKIWCCATNDKFELVVCQSVGGICIVVDTSYWHQYFDQNLACFFIVMNLLSRRFLLLTFS